MKCSFGRYLFGLAAIASGICAFLWHDFFALSDVPHHTVLTYIAATVEVAGGFAILWPKTIRIGALGLAIVFFIFAVTSGAPSIVKNPLTYAGYGSFFYPFSLAAAAWILYAASGPGNSARAEKWALFGYYSFGISLISFALEHLYYLHETATMVPKWIPPGQMFWAIATTVAFALAGIALLTRVKALLAAELTVVMIIGFGLLTWLPTLVGDPHVFWSWSETAETFAIAGAGWVVADMIHAGRFKKFAPAKHD